MGNDRARASGADRKAGVRPSIEDPLTYQDVNVRGTQNLLEIARRRNVKHFVFASSSSVPRV